MAKRLNKAAIETIFSRFEAAMPEPLTELEYRNPFTLLVAVVLSAQATDVSVNKATKALFDHADNPAAMLALGEEGIKSCIKTIGLFNSKSKNVMLLCQQVLALHGGEVPHDRAALEALPGVGRKTASVWLNCVLGQPTIAVDTHVFRVSHRMGMSDAKTPDATEKQLESRIPMRFRRHAHHWLILHGRYHCTARAPKCTDCVQADVCLKLGV